MLDVNVGAPMVDETRMLPLAVTALTSALSIPLCLDTSNPEAMRAGLDVYPASPLVNSISGEADRMEVLGPLCRDYGAPFILLPGQNTHRLSCPGRPPRHNDFVFLQAWH